MPFGKPKASSSAPSHISPPGKLELVFKMLRDSGVTGLPPDDTLSTRERFRAAYERVLEALDKLQWQLPHESGPCRSPHTCSAWSQYMHTGAPYHTEFPEDDDDELIELQ